MDLCLAIDVGGTKIAAGLVSQGLTILESVRRGVGVGPADGTTTPNNLGNGQNH